jgi:uncharacterized protein YkwD
MAYRFVVGHFALAVVLGLTACGSVEETASGPSEANPLDSEEGTAIYDVNQHRKEAGISAVKVCASLNVAASAHADDMRDQGYLSDVGKDGSTARQRACAAGYQAACAESTAVAELVASGVPDGHKAVPLWTSDATTNPILLNPSLVVAGIGRSLGGDVPVWALDLAGADEPSCQ